MFYTTALLPSPAGAASDLPQQAAAQLAAVKGGHQELLEQWRQQQHASRDHLNTVQQAVATLTDLVEGHLLGLQQVRVSCQAGSVASCQHLHMQSHSGLMYACRGRVTVLCLLTVVRRRKQNVALLFATKATCCTLERLLAAA